MQEVRTYCFHWPPIDGQFQIVEEFRTARDTAATAAVVRGDAWLRIIDVLTQQSGYSGVRLKFALADDWIGPIAWAVCIRSADAVPELLPLIAANFAGTGRIIIATSWLVMHRGQGSR